MTQKILQSKVMKLKDMPEFPRKIDFERIAVDENSEVVIVAVRGYRVNDWCAYTGLPYPYKDRVYDSYFPDFLSPAGVASVGDKLGKEDAELLFPEYKGWIYNW